MPDNPPVIAYLHGFNSSPLASKAQELARYIQHTRLHWRYLCPAIPDRPSQAIPFLDDFMAALSSEKIYLVGSSLGGYYATWLAEKYGCRALLVNPAIAPHRLWQEKRPGQHQNQETGVIFDINREDLDSLASIHLPVILHPDRYLVMLQMADEVLDATEASRQFCHAPCIIEPGGNHRFEHFDQYLPHVLAWLARE